MVGKVIKDAVKVHIKDGRRSRRYEPFRSHVYANDGAEPAKYVEQEDARRDLHARLLALKAQFDEENACFSEEFDVADMVNEYARRLVLSSRFMAHEVCGIVRSFKVRAAKMKRDGRTEQFQHLLNVSMSIIKSCERMETGCVALQLCRAADVLYGDAASSQAPAAMALDDTVTMQQMAEVPAHLPPNHVVVLPLKRSAAELEVAHAASFKREGRGGGRGTGGTGKLAADQAFFSAILCANRVSRFTVAGNHICLSHNAIVADLRKLHKIFVGLKNEMFERDRRNYYAALGFFKGYSELGKVVAVSDCLERLRTQVRVLQQQQRGGDVAT
jgi:hypothetical protein